VVRSVCIVWTYRRKSFARENAVAERVTSVRDVWAEFGHGLDLRGLCL